MTLRSFLVDFNSYFASVEQQVQPHLRGKPVGVVPMLADSTCLIAASYEAKAFGVKTLTNVGEAKRRIPEIQLVVARHELYIDFHHRAVKAVDSVVPVREVLSIDEMDCELTGRWREPERAKKLAFDVKRALAEQVGECLKVSVGIGPNTFIAKTASDMMKPDGLVVIDEAELPHRLYGLKLRDLSGIGKNMEARLNSFGINTLEQLGNATRDQLRTAWGGIGGEEFFDKLRGKPQAGRDAPPRSIGHSHVLAPDVRNDTDAVAILDRLTQKAAMRLRKIDYFARRMDVYIKYLNGPDWSTDVRFGETHDTIELLSALQRAVEQRPRKARLTPLQVGMALNDLLPRNAHSANLFGDESRRDKLLDAMDQLNVRFGKQAAYFAGAHKAMGSAKVAIAFNHIPDPETER